MSKNDSTFDSPRLTAPDDSHYRQLPFDPIKVIEALLPYWPSQITYHLGEIFLMLSRLGTRGQAQRDLQKIIWLAQRALTLLPTEDGDDT